MKLTESHIRSLIGKKEDERVEFKRASSELPDNLWETYSAFCNTDGGTRQCPDGKVHPTLAGLVCFGDFVTIMRVLPDYFLDYRERLSNETRWNDRVAAHDATWSGNIYDFFFKIHDRVTGDVKIPFKIAADGITRIDDTPVHKALREVLANALIHADYHGRRGIVVEKHFRTITFSNPGTMRISKSVAVAGGTSDARNTAIFNIFALVDIGERSGMGLANLHGLWKKYGYAEPKITESYDPDRTVIVVTTDDDTENDTVNGTVTRPESGAV